ncbi:sugar phosphate isomerase/epimerase family protein [Metabacillus endolithicus]|uniref:Sugar phosphate isomerase/epimerase family protein n=1 Tax=Metabacillus endolithicus TaxID=1535204 RepID=A0ABW5BT65_9BACI|nr:sugar phosphate isomerase/epimerase family protein [Metabacillus endolithicus]UPG63348.1 sugar phosphate isomerase/epimerase [Metabacillus endolithicus]
MIRGLTKAGLGELKDDKQLIELAAEYGFQSVDLDAKSFIDTYGLDHAKEILSENDVVIGSIGLSVEWRKSDDEFSGSLPNLILEAQAAKELNCSRCCTYILPSTDLKSAHLMSLAVKRLRICAEILNAYDIRLGLEYVGPHHLRDTWKNPFIWTQEETLSLIDAIGLSNVGLLLDSYHWHTTGLSSEDIANLNENQIVHVHINDAANIPVEELKDNERLYTGEGIIDLELFLKSVKKTGYNGPIAQEVLTSKQATQSIEDILKRSKAGFDKVFNNL